jgi:4a-hydroxytetrahydrobiopterin dehydratase
MDEWLESHPLWRLVDNALFAQLKFKDFAQAWAFMTTVALEAEKRDHHPDWSNRYNVVTMSLTTHSEGRITSKDLVLAEEIEKWANVFLANTENIPEA